MNPFIYLHQILQLFTLTISSINQGKLVYCSASFLKLVVTMLIDFPAIPNKVDVLLFLLYIGILIEIFDHIVIVDAAKLLI